MQMTSFRLSLKRCAWMSMYWRVHLQVVWLLMGGGVILLLCISRVVENVISGVFKITGDSSGDVSSGFANSVR